MILKKLLFLSAISINSIAFAQNFTKNEVQFTPELIGDYYHSKDNNQTILLIIAGSGPTDRNGNSGLTKNNALKFLAEGLADNKYNVVTYDKRVVYLVHHIKDKNKAFPEIDFQHGIDDAKTIINYLKDQYKYKNIVVLGHSEGALVGLNAISNFTKGYISLAGAGHPIDEIIKEQINKQAPFLNDQVATILDELKKGNKVKDVNPMLQALFNEANQPFIMDWLTHNPQEEIKTLKLPTLIINGDKDIQVNVKEAEALKQAKSDAELVIIKNMNHVLKEILDNAEQMKSYNDADKPLHPQLVPTIVQFLKKNNL